MFAKLDLKGPSSPSLKQFLYDEVEKNNIRSITDRFPNISKAYIIKAPLELAFHSSDISNTEQEVKIIVDELDSRLRLKITEWISAYKHIATSKLNIKKSSTVTKKKNELDFFNSESARRGDLLEICTNKNLNSDEQLDGNEKKQSNQSEKKKQDDYYLSCYSKALLDFEYEMLVKNNPQNYEYYDLLMILETDLKELKILDSGRLMNKFNKKPSMISSIVAFLILGIFFIILNFLLISKSSKKLMTKMSKTLLDLK